MVKQQRTLFLIGTISIFGDRRIERTNEALFLVKSEVDSDETRACSKTLIALLKGRLLVISSSSSFEVHGNVIYVKS